MSLYDFDEKQINQISLAPRDAKEYMELLLPELDTDIFRKVREIFTNAVLSSQESQKLILIANKGLPLTNLNIDIKQINKFDMTELENILTNCDIETINKLYKYPAEKRTTLLYAYLHGFDLFPLAEHNAVHLKKLYSLMEEGYDIPKKMQFYTFNDNQLDYIIEQIKAKTISNEIINSKFSVDKMQLISHFKLNGFDTSLIKPMEESYIATLLQFIEADYSIDDIYDKNYDESDLDFIFDCKKKNLNPEIIFEKYKEIEKTKPKKWVEFKKNVACDFYLYGLNMETIDLFLKNFEFLEKNSSIPYIVNIVRDVHEHSWYSSKPQDVSGILKTAYDFEQLNVIKQGYQNKIDLTKYCDNRYTAKQMNTLLENLKLGFDISNACNPEYSAQDMECIIFYNSKNITFDTIEEYRQNYVKDKNEDFKTFVNLYRQYAEGYTGSSNMTIISALVKWNNENEYQIDIENALDARVITYYQEFFEDLNKGVDVNKIWNKNFGPGQRKALAKLQLEGYDITPILDPNLEPSEMLKRKETLKLETLDKKIEKYKTKKENIIEDNKER